MDGKEILIMDIELGEGRSAELVVHDTDEPSQLAAMFCVEHGLDMKVRHILQQQIEQNLAMIESENGSLQSEVTESVKSSEKPEHNPFVRPTNFQRSNPEKPPPSKPSPQPYIPQQRPEPAKKSTPQRRRPASSPKELNRMPNEFQNVGQKLFFKGVKMQERTERNLQRIKQQKADKEAAQFTFKPITNFKGRRTSKSPEVALLQKGRQYQENNEKRRGQQLSQEMEQCTFAPEINRTSNLLQSHRSTASPGRFAFLYVDAKQREFHRSQLSES